DAARAWGQGAGRIALVEATVFASLIVAQVVDGTLVLPGDGSMPLVILRAVGFGLIAASLRPMPAVAAGALPAVFVAGGDARWAAIPAAFALIAALRAVAVRKSLLGGAGSAAAPSLL